MRIGIIGEGKMGRAIGRLAEQAGHDVVFGTRRDSERPVMAAEGANLVVLALPYAAALDLASDPAVGRALGGKTVVDVTNPLAPDFMSLTVGHTSSAAEEIARRLPGARVVKAFSTVFADVLCKRAKGVAVAATVLVAADDDVAKREIVELAGSFGLDAVDAGPLSNARYLEPMTELLIQLAYGKGRGTSIGFALADLSGTTATETA